MVTIMWKGLINKMISIEDFETNMIYRHYKKGKYYYVMDIALNTETSEFMVVYHALYGDYETYVRPFSMFVEKLNEVEELMYNQKYRFVPVTMAN